MDSGTQDLIKKRLSGERDGMREYDVFSQQISDHQVADTFRSLSLACHKHTQKLEALMSKDGDEALL